MGVKRSVDELSKKLGELEPKLGPEYAALMDGLQDVDPETEEGQEIESELEALDAFSASYSTGPVSSLKSKEVFKLVTSRLNLLKPKEVFNLVTSRRPKILEKEKASREGSDPKTW